MEDAYFEFFQFCLNDKLPLPESSQKIGWKRMMALAERQAVVGITYGGIQRTGKSLGIPLDSLLEWIGVANQIGVQNRLLNKRCVELIAELDSAGFDCCILKGQGNALMYPDPLLRNPGDIDVWVKPKNDDGEKTDVREVKRILRYVREKNPNGKTVYHHIDYGMYKGVKVEVHYRPTYMNNLIANRKLQRWMDGHKAAQFHNPVNLPEEECLVNVPTWEFNVVFQLSHIYRHVIQHGIGLRQMIDYYYLLKSDESGLGNEYSILFRQLGLMKIAGAVMWVLKEVLGMEERYLIAPVDERRGRFLLAEMLEGGNFGHYDRRVNHGASPLARNVQRLKRDIRLVRYFTSECLWEPVFRVYHFFWRKVYRT